jgi:SpoVK/Ycf46/Vps4 family AAA+-type ATPase
MDLSAKNTDYKNFIKSAKIAYSKNNIDKARTLFLNAAEITNQISINSDDTHIKQEYFKMTKSILNIVKNNLNGTNNALSNEAIDFVTVELNDEISLEDALEKLNSLIGLDNVKNAISDWVDQFKVFELRRKKNLKVPEMSYHMVFTGNPGTGKTTVGRIISQIYKALNIIDKGHLVEVDRSNLVAGYVGQTAIQTQEIIDKSIGGVLLIDEAYRLSDEGPSDFGHEAIATLLKAMEDKRDSFAVIVAGYEKEMEKFIKSNPGLSSRFKTYIKFDDYNPDELMEIFDSMITNNDYVLSEDARISLNDFFNKLYQYKNENFGNGRDVRNIFEKTVTKHSTRLANISNPSDNDLKTIHKLDLAI